MALIGRQSVSDGNYRIIGYDIMFRDEQTQIGHITESAVTASVLDRMMNEMGLENVLGGYVGFLKTDVGFLEQKIVETIPQASIYLMLLESSLNDLALMPLLKRLHAQGYRFGINDTAINDQSFKRIEALAPWIDIVKIDTLRSERAWVEKACAWLNAQGKKVVASKVETVDVFDFYKSIGSDYFQGFFIKRPHLVQAESFNPAQEELLVVWNLLQQEADTDEVVDAIEKSHALALQLMRFINSSFFAFRSPVTSIRQIVTLIGRKALGNWLLLMLASHRQEGVNHPLLLMVINRTEIMTGLLMACYPNAARSERDTAYLVGLLSLIHLLLKMEHRAFLRKINVSPDIEEAMFEAQGKWGELLTMTRHIENTDYASLQPYVARYGISQPQMDELIAAAMEKVNAFDAILNAVFE